MEDYDYIPIGEYVVKCKGVCGGRPTFKFTRIEPLRVIKRLESGDTLQAVIEDYPDRVSEAALLEAIMLYGSDVLKEKYLNFS